MVPMNFLNLRRDQTKALRFLLVLVAVANSLFATSVFPKSPPSPFISDSDALAKSATWKWSPASIWSEKLTSWINASVSLPASNRDPLVESARQLESLQGVELHERILQLAAQVDPEIAAFLKDLDQPWGADAFGQFDSRLSSLLANGAIPAWIKPDLQLAFARALIHHQLVDEAIAKLQPLELDTLSDPATCLFKIGRAHV